jgi:hypothetical protein
LGGRSVWWRQRWLRLANLRLESLVRSRTSELATANAVLEEKRGRLQRALDEVRTLRGIVPICMCCKKIRDDKGFWSQVEQYVSEHTEAQFSHGLCDDCERKMFQDEPAVE